MHWPFIDHRCLSKKRCLWFLSGLGISLFVGGLLWDWMDKVRWITGDPHLGYDQQPIWLKTIATLIGWFPIVSVVLVIALRLYRGRAVQLFSFLTGLGVPYIAMIAVLLGGPIGADLLHRERFSSIQWKNAAHLSETPLWPVRLRMVDDLISSKRLDGLTKTEVLELLGQPYQTEPSLGAAPEMFSYYLGPERGVIRIDSEWLVILFNDDGTVEQYRIHRD